MLDRLSLYHLTMIGNETDAMKALSGDVPMLASGCDRRVYLVNNVVYKVCRMNDDVNAVEYLNILNAPETDIIKFPLAHLYRVANRLVMAMEYIEGQGAFFDCFCDLNYGEHDCEDSKVIEMLNSIGMRDVHPGNIIVRDNTYYVIDFAE